MRVIIISNTMASAVLLLFSANAVFAQQMCSLTDRSTEEVIPGVTLRWDSSFHCRDAPDTGGYQILVEAFNASESAEAVTIESLGLSHATPRPAGEGPAATAVAEGLPIMLEPGESGDFTVSGEYELIETDEGKKANLHLRAGGVGSRSGEPFVLGINVLIRAPGSVD